MLIGMGMTITQREGSVWRAIFAAFRERWDESKRHGGICQGYALNVERWNACTLKVGRGAFVLVLKIESTRIGAQITLIPLIVQVTKLRDEGKRDMGKR